MLVSFNPNVQSYRRQNFKGMDISKIPHNVPHEQAAQLIVRRIGDGIIQKTEGNIDALKTAYNNTKDAGAKFLLKDIATNWQIAI